MDHQRYPKCALVDEVAMLFFTMFSQAFPMIGEENDKGFFHQAFLLQKCPKVTQAFIHVFELAIIIITPQTLALCWWKVVGGVQVVEVQENKKLPLTMVPEPLDSCAGYFFARTLEIAKLQAVFKMEDKGAVVKIETLAQSELPVQRKTPNESSCRVTLSFQNRRQRDQAGPQRVHIFLHSIRKWEGGRE